MLQVLGGGPAVRGAAMMTITLDGGNGGPANGEVIISSQNV